MPETMTKTVQLAPYLFFNGNCAEAIRFYETALGGVVDYIGTYGEAPMKDQVPPEMHDKIMNARVRLPGGAILFAGDTFQPNDGLKGVNIALLYDSVEEARAAYTKLQDGGEVVMPFAPTFWAEMFGMVTDRYGVDWMVNVGLQI